MKIIKQHLIKVSLFVLVFGLAVACSDDDDGYMNPSSPDFTPEDVITLHDQKQEKPISAIRINKLS